MKLMRAYPEVPGIWYASCFAFFVVAIVAVEVWPRTARMGPRTLGAPTDSLHVSGGYLLVVAGQYMGISLRSESMSGLLRNGYPMVSMVR
jgi:hypothetical protein